MAEEQDDIDITEGEDGGGKSKLIKIIIAVVVLVLIGVGAMLFFGGDDESATDGTDTTVKLVKESPIYYTVEEPLNVNFSEQSNGEVRYLQLKLKVMARDKAVIDAFKLHLPAIQHELLLLLYAQDYDTLNTSDSKALQQAVLAKANEVLKVEQLENKLEAVYFTSLLMQ